MSREVSDTAKMFRELLSSFKEKFEEAMDDDFNTALALGHIFELIRELNRFLDSRPSGSKDRELLLKAKEVLSEAGDILNIFNRTPYEWYLSLMETKNIGLSEKEIIEKDQRSVRMQGRKKTGSLRMLSGKNLKKKGSSLKTRKTELTGKSRSDSEWIYGLNPVLEAIRAGRFIKCIFVSSGRRDRVSEIKKKAEEKKIPVKILEPIFFDRSFPKGHQGVAAEVSSKDYMPLDELFDIPRREKPYPVLFDPRLYRRPEKLRGNPEGCGCRRYSWCGYPIPQVRDPEF